MTHSQRRTRRSALAFATLALLILAPQLAAAWWNDDWAFRKRIDIDLTAANLTTAQADVPVVLRLHAGNFAYFLDAQPDGSDLRFLSADDQTPLTFHVEHFDGLAGVASIWVRIPRLDSAEAQTYFWMYYGNDTAVAAGDPAGTWDIKQTAAFHFNDTAGLPKDATAFGHNAIRSSATAGASGLVDTGLKFDGTQSMVIESTPALAIDPERGNTLAFWMRTDGRGDDALILSQSRGEQVLRLGQRDLALFVEAGIPGDDGARETLVADTPLEINRWHFVVLTIGANGMTLRLDGEMVAVGPLTPGPLAGPIVLGAMDDQAGFRGVLDELRFASSVRPDAWLDLHAALQSQESLVVIPGEDESRDDAGGASEYVGLLWALVGAVRLEGWIIIGLLVLMGILSTDVMVSKGSLLKKVERADDEFMDAFDAGRVNINGSSGPAGELAATSPLASLHEVARREWGVLRNAVGKQAKLPPESSK